jgi:hypothetical protein
LPQKEKKLLMITKRLLFLFCIVIMAQNALAQQRMDDAFRQPPTEAKPIMIWQWMDGLVSAEGITADLEAYQQAGIGGVQQFLVGGTVQVSVCDSANAIGTDSWRRLMQHAISECSRLGLSFGSHNCQGGRRVLSPRWRQPIPCRNWCGRRRACREMGW